MAYVVQISSRAQRDLIRIYRRIRANDADAALKWYRGLRLAILRLRHLLYGHKPDTYRAISRDGKAETG